MKKSLILLSIILCISCDKNVGTVDSGPSEPQDVENNDQHSVLRLQLDDYRGQLPYLVGSSDSPPKQTSVRFEFMDKVLDTTVSWHYFDTPFSDALSPEQKQHYAYVILSKKDLIGLALIDPSNVVYQRTLEKYVSTLVDTDYFGYTLLWSALNACTNREFRRAKARLILAYSKNESFHTQFIKDNENEKTKYLTKVKEDQDYLPKIILLAED